MIFSDFLKKAPPVKKAAADVRNFIFEKMMDMDRVATRRQMDKLNTKLDRLIQEIHRSNARSNRRY